MASHVRSTINRILGIVRPILAGCAGLELNDVLVTALPVEQVPDLTGGRDILLAPSEELPTGLREGGGRHVNERERVVKVAVRTRCYLDLPDRDEARLLHDGEGHFALEDIVHSALESLLPTDGSGNVHSLPLLLGQWSAPTRGQHGKEKGRSGHVLSWIPCRIRYLRDMGTSAFAPANR